MSLTGKRVTIIGHSMGGLVTESFMHLNPNFTAKINKFIALGVPFDGCGGHSLEAMTMGYSMKLPLHKSAAKGV